jgi:hypothetical protein
VLLAREPVTLHVAAIEHAGVAVLASFRLGPTKRDHHADRW